MIVKDILSGASSGGTLLILAGDRDWKGRGERVEIANPYQVSKIKEHEFDKECIPHMLQRLQALKRVALERHYWDGDEDEIHKRAEDLWGVAHYVETYIKSQYQDSARPQDKRDDADRKHWEAEYNLFNHTTFRDAPHVRDTLPPRRSAGKGHIYREIFGED